MRTIETAKLEGAALDWAVAKCEGFNPHAAASLVIMGQYNPSTNWEQGGPIIERQKIGLFFDRACGNRWRASHTLAPCQLAGRALVAAMRCRVAITLGDKVDVPNELAEE